MLEIVGPEGDSSPLMLKNLPPVCRRLRQKISWTDPNSTPARVSCSKNAGRARRGPGDPSPASQSPRRFSCRGARPAFSNPSNPDCPPIFNLPSTVLPLPRPVAIFHPDASNPELDGKAFQACRRIRNKIASKAYRMTTRHIVIFLSGLILSVLYQRIKFAFNRLSFHRTPLRENSGLNIHHGHWEFLLAFISMNLLVFGVYNIFSIGLAGVGWGLMLDEIIPMLKLPSPGRNLELEIYDRSRNATFILMGVVVLLALVFFLIRR